MIELANKTFSAESDNKDWLEQLFANIESVWLENKTIRFTIIGLKKSGFSVKVAGLYAFLPASLMPWLYKDLEHWNMISPTLEGKTFYCKILKITQNEQQQICIYIDATIHLFKEIEVQEKTIYTGIILQKFEFGVLVDIGYHFDWMYGTKKGFLHETKFADKETFERCQPGQMIDIVYIKNTPKGMLFAEAAYMNLGLEYVGKTTWVKVYKEENTMFRYRIEDKHEAMLTMDTSLYSKIERLALIKKRKEWQDGEIIECEILDFTLKGFVIKWINNNDENENKEIELWCTEIEKYIGQEVAVNVCKTDERTIYLVENKYPVIFAGKYYHKQKKNFSDGYVLQSRITSFDYFNQYFMARLIVPDYAKSPLEIELQDNSIYSDYIGQTTWVKVCREQAEENEIDWCSDEMIKYLNKIVPVNISKTEKQTRSEKLRLGIIRSKISHLIMNNIDEKVVSKLNSFNF
jgi:ribosomal protein S1